MTQESLVGISEASQILGVSEAALRYWTDGGKIKAFITPGGHRRYSKAELKKFMSSRSKVLGVKDLVMELEYAARLQHEIAQTFLNTAPYSSLNAESRQHLAKLGRQLLNIVIRYLTEPTKREELSRLARQVGGGFGEALANSGLPLTDSVVAFTLHRNPLTNATIQFMKKREALSGRVVDTIPMIASVMDEALVALVASHQRNQLSHNEIRGE